jgi:hypothetical protein
MRMGAMLSARKVTSCRHNATQRPSPGHGTVSIHLPSEQTTVLSSNNHPIGHPFQIHLVSHTIPVLLFAEHEQSISVFLFLRHFQRNCSHGIFSPGAPNSEVVVNVVSVCVTLHQKSRHRRSHRCNGQHSVCVCCHFSSWHLFRRAPTPAS